MPQKMVLSRIAASALAMGMVGGFTTAQAQVVDLSCQYFAAVTEEEDTTTFVPVTGEISVVPVAFEGNLDQNQVKKATGLATVAFEASEAEDSEVAIESGSFAAEVDAKLKDTETDDGLFSCVDSAQVRGVGQLDVNVEGEDPASWLIRSNSRLDGGKSIAFLGTGEDDVEDCPPDIDEPCSVHRVKASLKITAQGVKGNGDSKYERFNLKERDIFEAYVGARPESGEGLVLVCGCSEIPEDELEEPVEEEPVEE